MVKNPPANAGDVGDAGSIPRLGRYTGEENGNLLQYSCLGNPMDRGAWQSIVQGVTRVRHDLVINHQTVINSLVLLLPSGGVCLASP